MSSRPTIYLVGDAILDNYYMLSDKEQDLRKEIIDLGFEVNNLATDDVKVSDIINGIIPRDIYVKSRGYPYPTQKDGKIYPLKSVTSDIGVNKSFTSVYAGIGMDIRPDNMVVVSMGGNDIHSNSKSIILGVDYFFNTIITPDFVANYRRIIETLLSSCDKIILVSIYLPYLGIGSSYAVFSPLARPVMDRWNKFIQSIAQEYNIPVIDLSRTLDNGNRTHYGTDEARVSNITNKCIAKCIAHIYNNYQGYHIYYAPNLNYSNIIIE